MGKNGIQQYIIIPLQVTEIPCFHSYFHGNKVGNKELKTVVSTLVSKETVMEIRN